MRKNLYAILLGSTVLTAVGLSGGVVAETVTSTSSTLREAVSNLNLGTTDSEIVNLTTDTNTYDADAPTGYSVQKGSLAITGAGSTNPVNVYGSIGIGSSTVASPRPTLSIDGIGKAHIDTDGSATVSKYWTSVHNGETSATNAAVIVTNADLKVGQTATVVFANSNNTNSDVTAGNGGAIRLNENSTADINRSLFYNNKTQRFGGAIDVDKNNATITNLKDTYFINNSAALHGGALDVDGKIQNMTGTNFIGNTAADGGAAYIEGGSVTGSNNIFLRNTATGNGGALHVGVDADGRVGSAILTDTSFTANKAASGAAVYNEGGTVQITGGTMSSNEATGQGGAVYGAGTTSIDNATISENKAASGAGIYNESGNMTVSDVKLSNNAASGDGGALYNAGNMVLTGKTVLSGNTATGVGSNAYNAAGSTLTVSDVHDDIDLDYDPFTTTAQPAEMTTLFDQTGDIYNAGTMNFLNSEVQLHNGINTKQKNKTGTVNVQGSVIDLGGYNVPGDGTIYANEVNIKQDSEIRTHVRKATDEYGKIVADTITVNPTNTDLKLYYNMADALKPGETQIYTILDGATAGDFEQALANQGLYTVEKLGDGRYKVSYPGGTPSDSSDNSDKPDSDNSDRPDNPNKNLLCPGCDQNEINTAEGWEIYDTPDADKLMPEGTEAREIQQELWEGHDKAGYREALDGLAPDVSPLIQAHATEITRRLSAIVSERFYNSMERTGYVHNGKRFYRFPRHDSNLWVQGMYGKSKYDVRKGWDMDTKGIAVGFDGHVSEALRMGLSYAYTKADGDSVQRDTTIDSHTGMIYGEYNPNRFYANWLAMYTRSEYDEEKKVYNHRISANYDVDAVGAQVMLGRKMGPYVSGNWASGVIKPELGLRYIYTKQHGYTDSIGQKVGSADGQTLTGILGAQYTIGYTLSPSLSWYPELRAALTYDFVEPDTKTRVNLMNGSVYEVKTENMDRFGIEVGAKVGLDINRKMEVALEYEGLFKGDYTNHTGLANLKYKF